MGNGKGGCDHHTQETDRSTTQGTTSVLPYKKAPEAVIQDRCATSTRGLHEFPHCTSVDRPKAAQPYCGVVVSCYKDLTDITRSRMTRRARQSFTYLNNLTKYNIIPCLRESIYQSPLTGQFN